MTLLSLVNGVQDRVGLPRSTVVASSTDTNVRRLLGLANEEGRQLARRYPWQKIVTEKTFVSTATQEQSGAIPTDFDRMINGSFFNRTRLRRVAGPLSSEEWQAQISMVPSVLTDAYRIRGSAILLVPTPSAGDTYAFEYVSRNWCESSGGTDQSAWAADADVGLLDEHLMGLGVEWRFRMAVGLDYAEAFASYEREVTQATMRDGSKRTINYSVDDSLFDGNRPPTVPEGSWPL